MLSKILKTISMAAIVATGLSAAIPEVEAAKKSDFKVCWSIYVGWMPWGIRRMLHDQYGCIIYSIWWWC